MPQKEWQLRWMPNMVRIVGVDFMHERLPALELSRGSCGLLPTLPCALLELELGVLGSMSHVEHVALV